MLHCYQSFISSDVVSDVTTFAKPKCTLAVSEWCVRANPRNKSIVPFARHLGAPSVIKVSH